MLQVHKESTNFDYVKGNASISLFFPWLHKDNRNKRPKTKHHIYHKESGILDQQKDFFPPIKKKEQKDTSAFYFV